MPKYNVLSQYATSQLKLHIENQMSNIHPKKQAHILKDCLAEKDIHLKLAHAYEIIAHIHGYSNWNTCSALYKTPEEKWKIVQSDLLKSMSNYKPDRSFMEKMSQTLQNLKLYDTAPAFFNDPNLQNSYDAFKEALKNSSRRLDPIIDDIIKCQCILAAADLEFSLSFDLEPMPDDLLLIDEENKTFVEESSWLSDKVFICGGLMWNKKTKQIVYEEYGADLVQEIRYGKEYKEYYYDGNQSLVSAIPLIETSIDTCKKVHPHLPEFMHYVTKVISSHRNKAQKNLNELQTNDS